VGALNTPENKTVKPCTEQARIPKANGEFMQPGAVMRVQGYSALEYAAKIAKKNLAADAQHLSDGSSSLY
jgi:hypothetical protein